MKCCKPIIWKLSLGPAAKQARLTKVRIFTVIKLGFGDVLDTRHRSCVDLGFIGLLVRIYNLGSRLD